MRVALTLLFLGAAQTAYAGLSDSWLDGWTRCRVAIENGVPLNTEGLVEGTEEDAAQFARDGIFVEAGDTTITAAPARPPPNAIWQDGESHFWIMVWQYGPRRTCMLEPVARLDAGSIDAMKVAYEDQRQKLILAGRHEIRDESDLFLAIGLNRRNVNGHCTISAFAADLDGFFSGSGEQRELFCRHPLGQQQ